MTFLPFPAFLRMFPQLQVRLPMVLPGWLPPWKTAVAPALPSTQRLTLPFGATSGKVVLHKTAAMYFVPLPHTEQEGFS